MSGDHPRPRVTPRLLLRSSIVWMPSSIPIWECARNDRKVQHLRQLFRSQIPDHLHRRMRDASVAVAAGLSILQCWATFCQNRFCRRQRTPPRATTMLLARDKLPAHLQSPRNSFWPDPKSSSRLRRHLLSPPTRRNANCRIRRSIQERSRFRDATVAVMWRPKTPRSRPLRTTKIRASS